MVVIVSAAALAAKLSELNGRWALHPGEQAFGAAVAALDYRDRVGLPAPAAADVDQQIAADRLVLVVLDLTAVWALDLEGRCLDRAGDVHCGIRTPTAPLATSHAGPCTPILSTGYAFSL